MGGWSVFAPRKGERRLSGKSDPIDAEHAARTVLSGSGTATPKLANGQIEAVRVIKTLSANLTENTGPPWNYCRAVEVNTNDRRERIDDIARDGRSGPGGRGASRRGPRGRSQPRAANAGPGGRGQAEEAQVHRAVSTADFWRRQRAARSPARWAGCFAARGCTAPI